LADGDFVLDPTLGNRLAWPKIFAPAFSAYRFRLGMLTLPLFPGPSRSLTVPHGAKREWGAVLTPYTWAALPLGYRRPVRPVADPICNHRSSPRCEHSQRRHLLGAEALKEVKTPGVTLPDRLFGRYAAGPGRKEKATQSGKFPGCKPHGGATHFSRHAAYKSGRPICITFLRGLVACRKNSLGDFSSRSPRHFSFQSMGEGRLLRFEGRPRTKALMA
jgi:hypothetical protein